ncbi:cytochrome c biogenesis protein ResB [Spirochaeta dissipatitropha]
MKFLRSLRLTLLVLTAFVPLFFLQSFELISTGTASVLLVTLFSLLAINTAACTLYSLWHRPPLRLMSWAPHLIHIGLLFLIIGLALSSLLRYEETAYLEPGEQHQFSAGIAIQLQSSETLRNQRNDLVNWESSLLIREPGQDIREGHTAVNRPLKISAYRLYQTDWEERPALRIASADSGDESLLLALGEGFRVDGDLWILSQDESGYYFSRFAENEGEVAAPGRMEAVEGLARIEHKLIGEGSKVISGLRLAWDPGALPAGIGGILMTTGLLLYSLKRLRLHPESGSMKGTKT